MNKSQLFALSLITFSSPLLYACSPTQENVSSVNFSSLPDDLKDCKFYNVNPGGYKTILHITRCPNSSTSTNYTVQQGKATVPVNTVVIDGETYRKVEK